MFELSIQMIYRVSFIILLSFIFSRITIFKNIIRKKELSINDKIAMGFFFGGLGIIGTVTGIPFKHAIVNTRVIGAAAGGLLGGPITGLIAGLIAGSHRFLIDLGGFTSLSCAISTLSEGIIAGLFSYRFYKSKYKIEYSIAVGLLCETLQMILVILIAKPTVDAIALVKIIAFPMIFTNSIGIGLFISVIENLKKIGEIEGAYRSYQTLLIANKTLAELRKGLNKLSAEKITDIIYKATDFNAVAITNTKEILAHRGTGEDHHLPGNPIKTSLTTKVLKEGKIKKVANINAIDCDNPECQLNQGIIVPLKVNNDVIGTLKLYNPSLSEESITNFELARGLGNIFSNQLQLSQIEKQKNLKAKAELHALQAQINPHFLFNAINTIISLIRTNPTEARELLIHLSDYFRHNMNNEMDLIDIQEEIRHVNAYLKIEKSRFGEKLQTTIINSIEEIVYIPPLIIQPLVENAVKHGILKRKNGGTITVSIDEIAHDKIEIKIQDDGIGMPGERLNEITQFNNQSVGINNVYKRLKLLFNNHFTFNIESSPSTGTTVVMHIPKITQKEDIKND